MPFNHLDIFLRTQACYFYRMCLTLDLSSILCDVTQVMLFWQEYHRSDMSFSVLPIWRHMLLVYSFVGGINWQWSDYLDEVVFARFLNSLKLPLLLWDK